MKKFPVMLLAAGAVLALVGRSEAQAVGDAFALTTTGRIVGPFNPNTPGTISVPSGFLPSGLQSGEQLIGIDFRAADFPANLNRVYAITNQNRLYTVNLASFVATPVGTGFTPALTGTRSSMDFNIAADRIRIVGNDTQNIRINPITGGAAATDTNVAYAAGDPNAGVAPQLAGIAYDPFVRLFAIDSALDTLAFSTNGPQFNTYSTVGALGFNTTTNAGFDIFNPTPTGTGIFYASLTSATGTPTQSVFGTINRTTGAFTAVGNIGTVATGLIADIAIVPEPGSMALCGVAVAGFAGYVRKRRKA